MLRGPRRDTLAASPRRQPLQRIPRSTLAQARRAWASVLVAGLCACCAPALATGTPANLLLITLDTTRADHLGAWGWPHARTPNLDALARRGTRFSRCDTVAPITLPSHASILTGLLPPRHGVRDNGTFTLAAEHETLAERFRAAGYDTAAVVSAIVLARRYGLDQGFRIYEDDLGGGSAAGTEVAERSAEATTTAALALLGQLKPPYFLWVHYYDPHESYQPPSRFAAAATGPHPLYDGEIAAMDHEMGRLLAALPAASRVAVVADHGEMLGEEGEISHGLLLARAVRRVPLLLAGPGVPAGRVASCLVRTVDLAPTLLELAGLAPPQRLDGASLLPLPPADEECDRLTYSESFLPFFAYRWYPLRALSDGEWLFLQAPQPSLYRLTAEGGEGEDLGKREPGLLRSWAERFRAFLRALGEEVESPVASGRELSERERGALRSLGYAGAAASASAPRVVSAELPDPRGRLDVARRLHEATAAVQAGGCATALPALRALVAEDAHNVPALALAAQCLRSQGRLETALELYRQAAREGDHSAAPFANIAAILAEQGKAAEAEREYRHALALDPALPEAAANLARLLRQRGAKSEALAVLDGALAAGAHAAEVYLERGVARAESGKLADAYADFREAARRNPRDAVALQNAAQAAYLLGRAAEASELYLELLRRLPERGDLWKALGAIYLEGGSNRQGARSAFERALALENDPGERAKLLAVLRELGG